MNNLVSLLLKKDKEFYWDCIMENGHTTCPAHILKMYNNLVKKEYSEKNSSNFKTYVVKLRNLIDKEKISLNIISEYDLDLDKRMIDNLKYISKYLPGNFCILEKSYFRIDEYKNYINISSDIKYYLNECKYDTVIIPVLIKLVGRKITHFNIIIIDLKTRQAWRIEPNNVDSINIKMYSNELKNYFKDLNITFSGFYPTTCPINHGGLCSYVAYAQYLYGKNITYNNVKDIVLLFIKKHINSICK
jgi:hypothetical protein